MRRFTVWIIFALFLLLGGFIFDRAGSQGDLTGQLEVVKDMSLLTLLLLIMRWKK